MLSVQNNGCVKKADIVAVVYHQKRLYIIYDFYIFYYIHLMS